MRLSNQGYLVLMNADSGDAWLYSDAAFEGMDTQFIGLKRFVGQPVVRVDH
jgi:hypothetical protein